MKKKNKTKITELEDFEAKTHKLGKSQGKNAMGREKSDQCKRLDETECSKAREKKKLRENATNVENGKMEQQQGGGGGWVKCNKTKGRENRTCAWREIEVERQVQRARRKQRQVMINFNIQSAHIPSNQPEPR